MPAARHSSPSPFPQGWNRPSPSQTAAPMLEHHPDVDEILTITGHEPFANIVRLFRDDIDAANFLKSYRRLMAAVFVARIPVPLVDGRCNIPGISQAARSQGLCGDSDRECGRTRAMEKECGRDSALYTNILELKGQLIVPEFMVIIAASQVVVSGATEPAHTPGAFDVPRVSMYDIRRDNTPIRWRAPGKGLLLPRQCANL